MSVTSTACLRCMNEDIEPSMRFTYCAMSIGIIVSCVCCTLFAVYVTMMQFKYKYSNKFKNVILMMLIMTISLLYISNEFNLFRSFEKMEGFMRNLLFLACFYYFFDHMKILSRNPTRFYMLMLLVVAVQVVHFIYLLMRMLDDATCHCKLTSDIPEGPDHRLCRSDCLLHDNFDSVDKHAHPKVFW